MSVKNESIQGSLSVSVDIVAGRDLHVRGNSVFDHDVKIKGWLDARNIKGACKGLYASVEKLEEEYPQPAPGWYALIGNTLPADIYRSENGKWVPTGEKGGEIYLCAPFNRSVDLGNFTTDAELDDAVKAEALLVSPNATGGLPENKVIFASCSAGDQRNYTYFSLATGSQVRVVRFDPATGHLQICSRPKSSGIWSAWAELYDTDVPIASDTMDGLLTAKNWKRWMDTKVSNFNASFDDANLGSKIISAGWLSLDKPSVHSYERRDEDKVWKNGIAIIYGNTGGVRAKAIVFEGNSSKHNWAECRMLTFSYSNGTWKYDGSKVVGGNDAIHRVYLDDNTRELVFEDGNEEEVNRIDLSDEALPVYDGTYNTWDDLLSAMKNSLPSKFPCVVYVENGRYILSMVSSTGAGGGTFTYFAYDSAGMLHRIRRIVKMGVSTWDAAWETREYLDVSYKKTLDDLAANGRNWYRYGAVRAFQLFNLTTSSTSDEIKAALTDIAGNHPKQEGLDACIKGHMWLTEYVLGGVVMVGWSGQGYVLTYVGPTTPSSVVYACTITISAKDNEDGTTTYAVVANGSKTKVALPDVATHTKDGLMSAADKQKLDNISEGAGSPLVLAIHSGFGDDRVTAYEDYEESDFTPDDSTSFYLCLCTTLYEFNHESHKFLDGAPHFCLIASESGETSVTYRAFYAWPEIDHTPVGGGHEFHCLASTNYNATDGETTTPRTDKLFKNEETGKIQYMDYSDFTLHDLTE